MKINHSVTLPINNTTAEDIRRLLERVPADAKIQASVYVEGGEYGQSTYYRVVIEAKWEEELVDYDKGN